MTHPVRPGRQRDAAYRQGRPVPHTADVTSHRRAQGPAVSALSDEGMHTPIGDRRATDDRLAAATNFEGAHHE